MLFLSVPHLTIRTDREFLADMEDLQLYSGGNVQALCGVRMQGRAPAVLSEIRSPDGWLEAYTRHTGFAVRNRFPPAQG